ncbi:MAG: UPF0058 family protein [Halobacteriota archaeon]
MHKEELILLHLVLARMKKVFEEAGFSNEYFYSYEELTVRPVKIHRSKAEHREAIVILCRGILHVFEETPFEAILENPKLQESLLNLAH